MANKDSQFKHHLFWLAAHDVTFLKKYSKLLHPSTYENVEEAWFLEQCIEHFRKFKVPIPPEAIEILLDQKKDNPKFDKEAVVDLYEQEGPDETLIPFLNDQADDYLRRRLSEVVVQEFMDTLGDGGDFQDVFDVLSKGVTELSRSTEGAPPWLIGVDPKADFERMAMMFTLDGTEVATGIAAVDTIMQGGLRRGELGVYMAPPNHGKSQWLTFVAQETWKRNKDVLYISFEMGEDRIATRFFAGIVNEDSNRLTALPPAKFAERWEKARWLHKSDKHLIVKRYPDSGANANDVGLVAKELNDEGYEIGLIIVDYADIMSPVKKTGDRKQDQAAAYKELRNLAIELDLPIWTASQANRLALRSSVITMEHLADSFDKAKIADYIIAQCQTPQEKKANKARLFFAKCRYNGQGDQIPVDVDFRFSLFTQGLPCELSEEDVAA